MLSADTEGARVDLDQVSFFYVAAARRLVRPSARASRCRACLVRVCARGSSPATDGVSSCRGRGKRLAQEGNSSPLSLDEPLRWHNVRIMLLGGRVKP